MWGKILGLIDKFTIVLIAFLKGMSVAQKRQLEYTIKKKRYQERAYKNAPRTKRAAIKRLRDGTF